MDWCRWLDDQHRCYVARESWGDAWVHVLDHVSARSVSVFCPHFVPRDDGASACPGYRPEPEPRRCVHVGAGSACAPRAGENRRRQDLGRAIDRVLANKQLPTTGCPFFGDDGWVAGRDPLDCPGYVAVGAPRPR